MKKLLTCIAIITVVMCTSLMVVPFTTAMAMELDGDEYDQVFIETINELGAENYAGDLTITASKELVYDLHLDTLGYLYDFTINGENGYAIVIDAQGYIEVVEIYFDAEHPYGDVEEGEQWIYVQVFVYLVYSDNAYYSTEGELISEETLASLEETAYFGQSELEMITETVSYVSKTEDKHNLVIRYPCFAVSGSSTSTCGTIAGTNIIQYWDRYNTDLIANYTPGTTLGTQYLYHQTGTELTAVSNELYYDMGGAYGVTIAEFVNGIGAYCLRKGYVATFMPLNANGSFNYANVKQALNQNLPVVLFLDSFNAVSISTSGNTDTLSQYVGTVPHIMAGFGYRDITYTLSSGTRVDQYIAVAAGLAQQVRGYLNINRYVQIDDAYSINIA